MDIPLELADVRMLYACYLVFPRQTETATLLREEEDGHILAAWQELLVMRSSCYSKVGSGTAISRCVYGVWSVLIAYTSLQSRLTPSREDSCKQPSLTPVFHS